MLTEFDSGYLHCDQTSKLSPPHTVGELPRTEHPAHNALLKEKKETWKNSRYLWARKISFLHRQARLCGAEVNEKRGRLASTACSTPTPWLPAPWRHFFSSLLPQPPPTILKWLCMSHTPTSKHKASCISLFHAQAIPSITFLFSRDYKNLGCRHKAHTSVHAPTPNNSCEMLLALPLLASTCPMLVCCMVGESKTNTFATLTSPPANSLQ